MKRLEYIFIMFAAILLTTSCSKCQDTHGRNAGRNAHTLLHANFWEQC